MKHLNHPHAPSSSFTIYPNVYDNFGESKEDEFTDAVTTLPPKITPTPYLQVHKPVASFPNRLKGNKDQTILTRLGRIYPRSRLKSPCWMLSSIYAQV